MIAEILATSMPFHNIPNDLIFKSNSDLYFTDPPFGLPKAFDDPRKGLAFNGVFHLTAGGTLTLLTKEITAPNGIALTTKGVRFD